MEKKLGMESSSQIYLPHKQPACTQTELIPTQDWELAGTGPVGGFHGGAKPGGNLSQTSMMDDFYRAGSLQGYREIDFNHEDTGSGRGGGAGAGVGSGRDVGGIGLAASRARRAHLNLNP